MLVYIVAQVNYGLLVMFDTLLKTLPYYCWLQNLNFRFRHVFCMLFLSCCKKIYWFFVAIPNCNKIFCCDNLLQRKFFVMIELDELGDLVPKALDDQAVAIIYCNDLFCCYNLILKLIKIRLYCSNVKRNYYYFFL